MLKAFISLIRKHKSTEIDKVRFTHFYPGLKDPQENE